MLPKWNSGALNMSSSAWSKHFQFGLRARQIHTLRSTSHDSICISCTANARTDSTESQTLAYSARGEAAKLDALEQTRNCEQRAFDWTSPPCKETWGASSPRFRVLLRLRRIIAGAAFAATIKVVGGAARKKLTKKRLGVLFAEHVQWVENLSRAPWPFCLVRFAGCIGSERRLVSLPGRDGE